jgi:hypothetical protein
MKRGSSPALRRRNVDRRSRVCHDPRLQEPQRRDHASGECRRAHGRLIDLANVEAKLSAVRSRDLSSQYVAESGLTPLFRVVGFGRRWWWGEPKNGLEELGSDEDSEVQEASFDDYASSR